MSRTRPSMARKVQSVFHPSDFSEASEIAFLHALKTALVTGANLDMLHVSKDAGREVEDFPGIRETLVRWRLIPEGSPRSAVADLGIGVRKVVVEGDNPIRSCLDFLERHPADLVVLAVHRHEGRTRWLQRHVGEPLAHKAGQMTLFIPHGVKGFVSHRDGAVSLRNILIPVAAKPRPQPGVEAAARLIHNLGLPAGSVTLLHVGPSGDMPAVKTPDGTGWTWNRVTRTGEPAAVILDTASELAADLIVMTTDGADGFLDALRGTTSERVLRKADCPVLNLPVGSMLG